MHAYIQSHQKKYKSYVFGEAFNRVGFYAIPSAAQSFDMLSTCLSTPPTQAPCMAGPGQLEPQGLVYGTLHQKGQGGAAHQEAPKRGSGAHCHLVQAHSRAQVRLRIGCCCPLLQFMRYHVGVTVLLINILYSKSTVACEVAC